ncbi:hypothetical protein ACFQX7_09180 [Luedemannella flava]
MARRRRSRRLVVGDVTYRWSVRHRHDGGVDDGGRPRYSGCREVLTIRPDDALDGWRSSSGAGRAGWWRMGCCTRGPWSRPTDAG